MIDKADFDKQQLVVPVESMTIVMPSFDIYPEVEYSYQVWVMLA